MCLKVHGRRAAIVLLPYFADILDVEVFEYRAPDLRGRSEDVLVLAQAGVRKQKQEEILRSVFLLLDYKFVSLDVLLSRSFFFVPATKGSRKGSDS